MLICFNVPQNPPFALPGFGHRIACFLSHCTHRCQQFHQNLELVDGTGQDATTPACASGCSQLGWEMMGILHTITLQVPFQLGIPAGFRFVLFVVFSNTQPAKGMGWSQKHCSWPVPSTVAGTLVKQTKI